LGKSGNAGTIFPLALFSALITTVRMSYGTKKTKTENELRNAGYLEPQTPEQIWQKIKMEEEEEDGRFLFYALAMAFCMGLPASFIVYAILTK
jgi:hypothetical protein